MIKEQKYTRYTAICDICGWAGDNKNRKEYAERDLEKHPCGEHRQAWLNNGGHRGGLGGTTMLCICGERYVEHENKPFLCPRDNKK